jgi:GTPase SAR1 family protein
MLQIKSVEPLLRRDVDVLLQTYYLNKHLKWYEEVRSICGQHIPVILVGCKTDLREKARLNGLLRPESFVEATEVSTRS